VTFFLQEKIEIYLNKKQRSITLVLLIHPMYVFSFESLLMMMMMMVVVVVVEEGRVVVHENVSSFYRMS
jgi:hypothetical protein